ncbi:calcium-binding protein, partial [Inquilinus limosus]|uniref:calcium-binding protein n=1 Tax=Inquilinus limosus TaxID=171674 RepID=UPI003F1398FF
ASYADSDTGVHVWLDAGFGRGGTAEGDSYEDIEHVEGSIHGDELIGDDGGNRLKGEDGDDVLRGGLGADRLDGGHGCDRLHGEEGDDTLTGGEGGDVLIGGVGADSIDGGAGSDTAFYAGSAEGVRVDLATGQGFGGEAEGDSYENVENVEGSAHADVLIGNAAANRLVGGAGADVLDGGAGNDTVSYTGSVQGVIVDLEAGRGAFGDAEGDTYQGIENAEGSAHDDVLNGDEGANQLRGGAGDDRLAGGGGADVLDGGAGNDTASYAGSAEGVRVDLATGQGFGGEAEGDSYENVENVEGSAYADVLIGDAAENTLLGGAGADVFDGSGGADLLDGGIGVDTVSYIGSAQSVTVNLWYNVGYGGDAEGDKYREIERIVGSAHDDVLIAGTGVDILDGGTGADMISHLHSSEGVTVDLAAGRGSGGTAEGDFYSGMEHIEGSDWDDVLVGNHADNRLLGSEGSDILSGGDGNDVLIGGSAADLLVGGVGSDTVSYADADISDDLQGVTINLKLGRGAGGEAEGDIYQDIEHAEGSFWDDMLIGNDGANRLNGGSGNDQLCGGAGDDLLVGGGGDSIFGGGDAIDGGAGMDTVSYADSYGDVMVDLAAGRGAGGTAAGDTYRDVENIVGSGHDDVLIGGGSANQLDGGGGDDLLDGGGGADHLRGGAGADCFVYTSTGDSTAADPDLIHDLTSEDRLDLSAIDADGNASNGDTAFRFVTGDFTGHAGELRVAADGATQCVLADIDGDRREDLAIIVDTDHPLTAVDFVL